MLTLLLLLSLPHTARAENLCATSPCNAAQAAIQSANDAHPGFAAAATAGGVFSGACYHNWPNFDPAHEHYGLAVVDGTGPTYNFRGLLTFFAPKDPYAGLSYADADALLKKEGGESAPITVSGTDGMVLFKSSSGTIQYWLRSDGTDFYLLGAWNLTSGFAHSWCHFRRGGVPE